MKTNEKTNSRIKTYGDGKSRTEAEWNAYSALPELMQMRVLRNTGVRYDLHTLYFSDLLFEGSKVAIEIDGGYHKKRVGQDKERDDRFKERGYVVLRFKNEETKDKTEFLHKLLRKLEQIEDRKDRYGLSTYIRSLRWCLKKRSAVLS